MESNNENNESQMDLVVKLSWPLYLYKINSGEQNGKYKLMIENKWMDLIMSENCGSQNIFIFYSTYRIKCVRVIFVQDSNCVQLIIRNHPPDNPYNWIERKYEVTLTPETWDEYFNEMKAFREWVHNGL